MANVSISLNLNRLRLFVIFCIFHESQRTYKRMHKTKNIISFRMQLVQIETVLIQHMLRIPKKK